MSEATVESLREVVAARVASWADEVIAAGGDAAYDALEGAYLNRDWRMDELSPAENTDWRLAMVLSTALLIPVVEAASDFPDHVERPVPPELDETIRGIVDAAVVELRGLVCSHREPALIVFRSLGESSGSRRADDHPTLAELLDSLIGIFADADLHELEDRFDSRR